MNMFKYFDGLISGWNSLKDLLELFLLFLLFSYEDCCPIHKGQQICLKLQFWHQSRLQIFHLLVLEVILLNLKDEMLLLIEKSE